MLRITVTQFSFLAIVLMLVLVVGEIIKFLDHINGTGKYIFRKK